MRNVCAMCVPAAVLHCCCALVAAESKQEDEESGTGSGITGMEGIVDIIGV